MSTIAVVGDGLLSWQIARLLDTDLARQVQHKVIFFNQQVPIYWPERQSLLSRTTPYYRPWQHLTVNSSPVRSVDLSKQYIVAEDGVTDYDWLILDRLPRTDRAKLAELTQALQLLTQALQAKSNTGQTVASQIIFEGTTPLDYQVATLAVVDRRRLLPKISHRLAVVANQSTEHSLAGHWPRWQLHQPNQLNKKQPGLSVKPLSGRPSWSIRGLKLDNRGQAVTDGFCQPIHHDNTVIFDSDWWPSLSKSTWQIAKKTVDNLSRRLAGEPAESFTPIENQYFIYHPEHSVLVGEALPLTGWPAKLTGQLDHAHWRRVNA